MTEAIKLFSLENDKYDADLSFWLLEVESNDRSVTLCSSYREVRLNRHRP